MSRRRRGFTFVELLVVLIVFGVLTSLMVLRYMDLRHRAVTAAVVADLEAIRIGAYNAYYEGQTWPAEVAAGVTPPDLAPFLGRGFSFVRPDYKLDWENFAPPGGGPSGGLQVGVVVSTQNTRLIRSLHSSLGNRGPFAVVGNTLTYVIVGSSGRF